ncbi:MAG: hypothetical protein AAB393_11955 [Bacteroidota bacterium]
MAQTRFIHFRVTNEQFNTIKANANSEGFKSMAQYLRDMALHINPQMRTSINEIRSRVNDVYELSRKTYDRIGSLPRK